MLCCAALESGVMDSNVEEVGKALFAAEMEIRYLKETVTALRDELDRNRISEHQKLQQALASVDDEKRQLQVIVAMLRDELDRTHINLRQETEKMELRHLQECRELRETIE